MPDSIYVVNIKADMPTADQAVRRVGFALDTGRRMGAKAVKVIHGYGSTGQGGRIRAEARRSLEGLKSKGKIKDYIHGESFSIFDQATLRSFTLCPDLRRDCDLDNQNNGITIVLL